MCLYRKIFGYRILQKPTKCIKMGMDFQYLCAKYQKYLDFYIQTVILKIIQNKRGSEIGISIFILKCVNDYTFAAKKAKCCH